MQWFKYLSAGSILFGWFLRSAKDGVITVQEFGELLVELNGIFNMSVKFELEMPPGDLPMMAAATDVETSFEDESPPAMLGRADLGTYRAPTGTPRVTLT